MFGHIGAITINTAIYPSMPLDPVADLAAVAVAVTSPLVWVVNPETPFRSMPELVARVRALLRRAAPETTQSPLEFAGLRLEPDTLRVFSHGTTVDLSPTEFRLLQVLMRHPDRVLSRSLLLDRVWGDTVYIEERTVDVHIRRLRLALTPGGHDRLIETVRGGGYRFLPQ